MRSTYNAISASAGSGKTYTLVQRILIICLKQKHQHDAIKHILALTFTNKAANEMKERILEWLKEFTQQNFASNQKLVQIQKELEQQGLALSLETLHHRAQKVLDYVLHHYSTLNIGTIDRFNLRLVRSFSYELGLAHQFNLEIQSEPFLIEAVDKMLENIGTDEKISEAFMDYVTYNLDNEQRTFLNDTLYKKSKSFDSDIHYEELKSNQHFDWNAYEKAKQNLREAINNHRREALKLSKESIELFTNQGLTTSDFSGGVKNGLGIFFEKYLNFINGESAKFPFPADERSAQAIFDKLTSSTAKKKKHLIEEIFDELIANRNQIIAHYIAAEKKDKILRELLPLKINKEIQEKLKEIEEENDVVLLSKFNVLISENLRNEPSAFIYEKIGTRFHHYFFDEFQDTSKMQWSNFIPLRDHTVNTENNSFTLVGDPKQSIYRFRGGDSDIMIDILNNKKKSDVPVEIKNLDKNFRSAKNLVDFNNNLYHSAAEHLNIDHKDLFQNKGKQFPNKEMPGRVKVNLVDYTTSNAPFYETVAEQMHADIKECVKNGYSLSDITILCRAGKEIRELAKLLGQKTIHYKGEEIFVKTISEKGLTLSLSYTLRAVMEFLNWELQPNNKQFLVRMMFFLNRLGRIQMEDFSKDMLYLLQLNSIEEMTKTIETKCQLNLNPSGSHFLNLYNTVEFFVKEFSVEGKETDFLMNFLEVIFTFTQNAGANLRDLLKYWEEEAQNTSIQVSDNVDAINFMTIHAAKGLEFPVVFIPMKNEHKDSRFNDWLKVSDIENLNSINLKQFDSTTADYDPELAEFNEVNSYKNKVDRFCTNYVATTRAVEQLFLYLQKPSSPERSKNEIYDFVTHWSTGEASYDLYPEENGSYQKHESKKEIHRETLAISNWTDNDVKRNNIKIATPSRNYQNTVDHVRMGIFTHEILAKIKTKNDVEKVMETYVLEGTLNEAEKQAVKTRILNIIDDQQYAEYFKPGIRVINEKDIMISENGETQIFRPDRLIETNDGFYIIDFKTGTEDDRHQKQLKKYQHILERLGKKVHRTKIIYI